MSGNRRAMLSSEGVRLDGKRLTLYGSEFFYFRHDPAEWKAVIGRLRAANCNTVTLPIPWNWHELPDGKYDFDGKSHPRRNLRHVLELLKEEGFYAIARPGPYICAEWDNGGIPEGLLVAHPEILSLDASGSHLPKIMDAYPVITSLHPAFLERVATWYDAVCEVLRPRQWTAGGPIISVEIDGEPSYWMTIPKALSSDYNPFITGPGGLFESWLRARYGSVRALNLQYTARHRTFADVPPPRTPPRAPRDYPRLLDWHRFKLDMVNEYVAELYALLLARGIDVPLSLLDPYLDFDLEGWETFRTLCQERDLAILPTTEIYPSGVWESYRTSHIKEDAVQYVAGKLAIYRSLAQRLDAPRICVEAQAAATYRLDQDEADLLYHMLVAFGLDHIVYWTIPSGTNPFGWGRSFTGTVYDQSNAIGPDGGERPHYETIKRMGTFLRDKPLDEFAVLSDTAVGFYEPYRALSYVGNTLDSGLRDDIADTLRQSFFPSNYGLLSLLALSSVTFDATMLETETVEGLLKHPQLWILTLDIMDAHTQAKLVAYVERGGCLVMLPRIPTQDLGGRPCTLLADAIGARGLLPAVGTTFNWFHTPRNFVRYEGSPDEVLVFDYVQSFDIPPHAEPLVWNARSGAICGFSTPIEAGRCVVLGFKPSYTADGLSADRGLIWRILEHLGARRVAHSESEELQVVERSNGSNAYLFVLNAGGWPVETRVQYTDPRTGRRESLPKILPGAQFARRGGLVLPINLAIEGAAAEIEYATSEVLQATGDDDRVTLRAFGQPGTQGEIAVRLPWRPGKVSQDGAALEESAWCWDASSRRLTATYQHPAQEFDLLIEP